MCYYFKKSNTEDKNVKAIQIWISKEIRLPIEHDNAIRDNHKDVQKLVNTLKLIKGAIHKMLSMSSTG